MSGDGTSILIVDDHPLIRQALDVAISKAAITDSETQHAESLDKALSLVKSHNFDLILLDLNLSDSTDFDGLSKLKAERSSIPVMIISANETADVIQKAQALGAQGYIPKSSSLPDMTGAILRVLDGETSFPNINSMVSTNESLQKLQSLTHAQKRVMSGLSSGLLNKQIAYEMGISEATVKAHMTAIFRKLGANNRTQALLIYRKATQLA